MTGQAYLIVRSKTSEKKVELSNGPVTVGRHRSNILYLPDERISRYHCVIEWAGLGVRVTDLGSRNGTRLNGERLTSADLRAGDRLRVGGVEIELVMKEAASTRREVGQGRRPPKISAAPDAAPQPPRGATAVAAGPPVDSTAELKAVRKMIRAVGGGPSDERELTLISAQGRRVEAPGKTGEEKGGWEAITFLRLLLVLCRRSTASDLHVEPREAGYGVRIRVDGMMVPAFEIAAPLGQRLLSAVKVLCDLDIAQRQAMQDGHFSSEVEGQRIDYRVSFTPVLHGQKLVVRVLDLTQTPTRLDQLGLPGWMDEQVRTVLQQNSGMLLVCGPTGSGKTTTLYAAIREVDVRQRNVITIEDPPEYQIEGVTQTPINEQRGSTFSSLLRSILRQDPDVIYLGEVRDGETAQIALQAAMTGHLVLSTVHARDTIGTVFRLLDLGAEPYLVASALNLVLAQRLVRRLCDRCKTPVRPKPQQLVQMGRSEKGVKQIHMPVGCSRCLLTGYRGRLGVFELLTATEEVRDVILQKPSMQQLRRAIRNNLFTSLKDSGYQLVVDGKTSLNEIERVMGHT